jgi:hypothetical protein
MQAVAGLAVVGAGSKGLTIAAKRAAPDPCGPD